MPQRGERPWFCGRGSRAQWQTHGNEDFAFDGTVWSAGLNPAVECLDGEIFCGGGCANLGDEPLNCGACANACEEVETCHQGSCTAGCDP